ncbi:ABC transporter integral membrane protein [Pectobacterium atrosepticum SCRI1043]|uniref:D-methionine transport system permease protein MetI n=1 Tax=Pectobacterium atrosepticum (strain SCRI 1043 / ATCC BAA-672) TaxID=218491 RepID=Q6D3Q7_PECAS|nr:methionine ABC transporter permease [Pectobacterium atrosepticum]GKV85025.1 ABC transporter permease [Pectobacterium carotovorum subsp. carotovorum]AIA71503.1 methionine ABC transporter permease [Pectobacterium atrosepticum]AIK13692.1 binding-protein-dependent transport systems inner membrane component [Pectobacterium atrosepticum]ATY90572.1 ABC transporter permease [Pectobacterium atrosepticum]KFX16207.1 methionine ABC transporter permease [Pectobacterium atrosepticum]
MADLWIDLIAAFGETFQMVGISTLFAVIGGLPLGLLIYVTDRNLFWQNRAVYLFGTVLVNIIRSIPFVILLVLLLPLTQILLGNTIGPVAAAVPMSVAAIAFYARLVDSALREIDPGIVEAAEAFGASPMRIIGTVLLPEAKAGLLRGLTITLVSLIGYSAMAGIVGGGGVGDLAIRFGYYRYETEVMVITVIALVILVQVVQTLGDGLSKRADKRERR